MCQSRQLTLPLKDPVLFLLPYPLNRAPSQRFRVEAFFGSLQEAGVSFITDCFLSEQAYEILYGKGAAWQKALAVLAGFLRRLWVVLFVVPRFRYIFVHRGAAPLGPPVFEWIIVKVFRKKLVFDFDDAIWIPVISEHNRSALSLKCSWKVAPICRWAHRVVVGNDFLAAYARQHNERVTIIPTCVDTRNRFNRLKDQHTKRVVVGWTGTHSTLPFLAPLVPVLQQLEQSFDFDFLVICNQPPAFTLRNLQYLPWHEATEIKDLLRINIGVMPLEADAWSEGKCGFKIIQYMALGIAAVASPVGVNKTIMEPGVTGFLCAGPEEWYQALATLLNDAALRVRLGSAGRRKMEQQYSLAAHGDAFAALFSQTPGVPFTSARTQGSQYL